MVYYLRIENRIIPGIHEYVNCFKEISKTEYQSLLKEDKAVKVKFYATSIHNALEEKTANRTLIHRINKCFEDFIRAAYPSIILDVS